MVRFTALTPGGMVPLPGMLERRLEVAASPVDHAHSRAKIGALARIALAGVLLSGCGTSFGLAPPNDAASDAAGTDDASSDDVTTTDGATFDRFSGDQLRDDDARDAARPDLSSDGPSDAFDVNDAGGDGARGDAADGNRPPDVAIDVVTDVRSDSVFRDAVEGGARDSACTPEADREFCARLGKTCEVVIDVDNCGAKRSANCGTCTTGLGCVDGVCKTPVCSSFTFSSAVYKPFSVTGGSDFAIATSAAGESVLYAQAPGPDCTGAVVYLADEITPGTRTYTSRALSTWLDSSGLTAQALSGDGLTIVTLSKDFKTFQSSRRSALQLLDFGVPSAAEFVAVNAMTAGTPGSLRGGVLSPDGLEFFFTIFNGGTAIDGIYSAKRSATNGPFSTGARLAGIDSAYTDVTGVSSDRLTLFVFKPWAGFVFTRSSTSADFSNPNAPNSPPELAGWQHKPVGDCATLFATYSPSGGCVNEDLVIQTRK